MIVLLYDWCRIPIMTPEPAYPNAAICHANYARFTAHDRRVVNPCVQSRMCLWCKGGSGQVIINGTSFRIEFNDYFVLPWNHRVEYRQDPGSLFYLAGIHIVPDYDPALPIVYEVAHSRGHGLYEAPGRGDLPIPALEGVRHRRLEPDSPLYLLSESIVQWFRSPLPRSDAQVRLYAQVLLLELIRTFTATAPRPPPPLMFRKVLAYVDAHLNKPMTVDELAREAGRSKSGLTALFRAHCGLSPVQWIHQCRMSRACELLSTTTMPIGVIGAAVGVGDAFYFSKLFKKRMGQSPLAYRRQRQHL